MQDQRDILDSLQVQGILLRAEIEALMQTVELLAERAGMDRAQIAAMWELQRRRKLKALEEMMIGLEDNNPAFAARLQQIIDESKDRMKEEGD